MEHLNHLLKGAIHKPKLNIVRVGKCISTLSDVMDSFDEQQHVQKAPGKHTSSQSKKDKQALLSTLTERARVFDKIPNRTHEHFKKFERNMLYKIRQPELLLWRRQQWTKRVAGLL